METFEISKVLDSIKLSISDAINKSDSMEVVEGFDAIREDVEG